MRAFPVPAFAPDASPVSNVFVGPYVAAFDASEAADPSGEPVTPDVFDPVDAAGTPVTLSEDVAAVMRSEGDAVVPGPVRPGSGFVEAPEAVAGAVVGAVVLMRPVETASVAPVLSGVTGAAVLSVASGAGAEVVLSAVVLNVAKSVGCG